MKAIIIGGGVCGVCAAIALRQAGVEAVVYEKAVLLGDMGAGLVMWSNAIRALRTLGLADEVIAAGAKIGRGEILTAEGKVLQHTNPGELEKSYGEPTAAIHRAALHKVLLAALPASAIHLNKNFVRAEQNPDGVSVCFEDGSVEHGDLLIGADGIRSAVRRQFLPNVQLRYSGYTAWRGVVTTRDEAALGVTSETWGRGRRFGIVRMDAERVYWFATANAAPGKIVPQDQRKRELLAHFGEWHHPIPHVLNNTPEQAILQNDIYDIPPIKNWGVGRVTVLGDAAHATTPNLGQGACMAIESAVTLARCFGDGALVEPALRAYERIRQPRTAWITKQSWRVGQIGQMENPVLCALRNAAFAAAPRRALERQMAEAVGRFR